MPNLGNQRVLHFEFQCQKLLKLYHNTCILLLCIDLSTKPYRGLWLNRTRFPLFQNMSVKIYINFFLCSGDYSFKYINQKWDIKNETWNVSSYLAEQFGVIPIATRVFLFWHRRLKRYEKAVKFYPEIFNLKFSCDEIIKTIGLILRCKMFGVTIVFFYC